MDNLPVAIKKAINEAIAANQKLDAVKLYKDATGCDLRTAKEVIETKMLSPEGARTDRVKEDFAGVDETKSELILDAIFERRKLDAVKLYRDTKGVSLKAAKEFIEQLTERLEKDCPEQFRPASTTGCASALFVLVLIGIPIASLIGRILSSILAAG
jgi:ribosomal protein L7/L12